MKILVLGGTRFLGKRIVEEVLDKGHDVTLFNRGTKSDLFPNLELIKGDRDGNLAGLKDRKWDAVIDTCGFAPWTVSKSAELLSHVHHYTYISSASVYRDHSEVGIDENAEVLTIDGDKVEEIRLGTVGPYVHYGPLKALSERAAEKAIPGKVLVVRAGQIVGRDDYTDRLPYWVRRVSQGGKILAPGRPERPIQFIDAKDIAKWVVCMVEENVTGTFNTVGPNYTLTMKQLLDECKRVSMSDATFTWVSEGFLMNNKVEPWGEMPLWIPEEYPLPGEEKPWKGFLAVNNKKAIDNGLTFRPLSEILKDVHEWEKTRPEGERKAGMALERESELLEKWHEKDG